MNTDKLMELERKWRAQDADCTRAGLVEIAATFSVCADELAAALRAEQEQGEDEAREDARLVGAGYTVDGIRVCPTRVNIYLPDKAEQAVGTARQSEGMVLVPREPTPEMLRVFMRNCEFDGEARQDYADLLAAAPGGEGEADK